MNHSSCRLQNIFRCHGSVAAYLLTLLSLHAFVMVRGYSHSGPSRCGLLVDPHQGSLDMTRARFFRHFTAAVLVGHVTTSPHYHDTVAHAALLEIPPQKSYSTNARNLDRLNAGDSSGGSIYDNNPSQPAARKRRAMQGCKFPSARVQAANILGYTDNRALSEKDCNMQVMQDSPDFMLQALQQLECPTCPYGIQQ